MIFQFFALLTIVNILTLMASRVPTSYGPLFGSWILNSNGASLSKTTVWPSDRDGSISSIAEKSKAFNTDCWLWSLWSFPVAFPYGSINLELEFIILCKKCLLTKRGQDIFEFHFTYIFF